jgi:thiol-disulfide isomerase/thioredoxin
MPPGRCAPDEEPAHFYPTLNRRKVAMSKIARNSLAMAIALACLCLFTRTSRAEEAAWMTDFAAAKAKAKAEKKLLLVDFTGSDWCSWCKRLHNEVFDKDPFKADAPKNFILVELDFPHEKKLPDELKAQNGKLAKQYKIRGYPTVLLLDPEGEVVAQTGYRPGGAEKYVENLGKLVALHETVVKLQGELANVEGLDRAKLLDRLVDATTELGTGGEKIETWTKEIIALDTENKAGLKGKYEVRLLMAEVAKLIGARKFDEARKTVDKVLALPNLTAAQKQEAYYAQGYMAQIKRDLAAGLEAMQMALDAAPDGPKAAQIKSAINMMQATIKREEAALKIKAELDKAAGPERLALLDKTIQAYAMLGNRIGGKDQSAEVQKWSQEIISLDADNKAGLKHKYEFAVLFGEGQELFRARKTAEALAAFDKALAMPEITPADVSRAMLMKCNCLILQKDYQGAIDCAKKAEETAKGTMSTIFGLIIKQAERALQQQKTGGGDSVEISPIQPSAGSVPMMPLVKPLPAGKAQPAGEKSAASDLFKVPNGTIEELLKYVADLKKERCKENNFSAMMEFRRNVAMASVEAADKILAAKPSAEQKTAALKIKLEGLSSLPLNMVNDKLIAKQEELVKQLQQAEMPKEAGQATRVLLVCKVQVARSRGPKELEHAIDAVIDFFKAGPVDAASFHLAISTCQTAEYSGQSGLALKTYRDLGNIFAGQKDKEVVEMGAKFAGAARRLELTDKPMLVVGTTLEGKPLDWSKYSGKVVLIDFWATWCGPCRAELPNVVKNYEAYHDRGFEVVGISLDQKREDVEKFLEKEKLPWTIVLDESWNKSKSAGDGDKAASGQLANYYGVFGIPTAILLGKDGKAISLNARGEVLSRELEKAFGPVDEKK